MKKLIAVILLLIAPVVTAADFLELNQKVYCNDIKFVFELIRKEFKEVPIWYGDIKTASSKAIIFANSTTNTWTYVIIINDKACIANIGEGFAIRTIEEIKPNL